jgi:hypothetical protein
MSWSCRWNVRDIYICNEKKETVKICETFLDKVLVTRRCSVRKKSSSLVQCREWLGIHEFLRMTKSDFESLIQKIGPRIQRKDTKFREAIPPSIRLALTLGYLASGDFSLNFCSVDFILLQENQSNIFRHVSRSNSTNKRMTHWKK